MFRLIQVPLRQIAVIAILTSLASAHGEEQFYKVQSSSKTLLQIARDLYKDERMWNRIAYWNGLPPPFLLNKGQILVLKMPTKAPISRANQVQEKLLRPFETVERWPSVARDLQPEGPGWIYLVNERAPSLSTVARDLYNDLHMSSVIAGWNGLPRGAKLKMGQRLRIIKAPVLSSDEGDRLLREFWSQMGNANMVARLGGDLKLPNSNRLAKPRGAPPLTPVPTSKLAETAPNVEERTPQSTLVRSKRQDLDPTPAAHRTESYWLGDDAARLIEVIELKLRSLPGHQ